MNSHQDPIMPILQAEKQASPISAAMLDSKHSQKNQESQNQKAPKKEGYKFFIKVKDWVEATLMFSRNGQRYLGELWCPDMEDSRGYKIFNGTLPADYQGRQLRMVMMAGQGETYYTFDKLFSIPLTTLYEKKITRNCIIINAPQKVNWVIIDVPKIYQDKLRLPSQIIPLPSAKPPMSDDELRSRGINPDAKHFIEAVDVVPEEIDPHIAESVPLRVRCYSDVAVIEYDLF